MKEVTAEEMQNIINTWSPAVTVLSKTHRRLLGFALSSLKGAGDAVNGVGGKKGNEYISIRSVKQTKQGF